MPGQTGTETRRGMEDITMNETKTAETKERKHYIGRRALLNIILSKTPSTQKWLVNKLTQKLRNRSGLERKLRQLARKEGVRIGKLELK
jgi:hypothetical protein